MNSGVKIGAKYKISFFYQIMYFNYHGIVLQQFRYFRFS